MKVIKQSIFILKNKITILYIKVITFTHSRVIGRIKNIDINELEHRAKNLPLKKRAILLFSTGLANFFASAPIGFIWVLFISFPIFFVLLLQVAEEKKFKQFYLDIIFFIGGFSISQFNWLVAPLLTEWKFFIFIPFAILLPPLIFVSLNVFCLLPFYLLTSFFFEKNTSNNKYIKLYNNNFILKIILFALCYIFGEFIRGEYLFGGFQWQLFGNLFSNLFLIQILKFCNIYIYSFIYFLICFLPFLFYKKISNLDNKFKITLLIGSLFILIFGFLTLILNPKKEESKKFAFVAGIQNNIQASVLINETSYQKITRIFSDAQTLGRMPPDSLLLMPEASFDIFSDNYLQFFRILGAEIKQQNSLLVSGAVFFDRKSNKMYNSIFFIDGGGNLIGHYKKKKLVPFGEYIPLRRYLPTFLKPITGEMDFSSDGRNDSTVLYRNFPLMFPLICYEVIFSETIKKRLDHIKSEHYFNKEKVIINLTNDVWSGRSVSAYQHFRMARMTAVRASADIIRLSNNGISAVIDKNGRILQNTPLNTKAVLLTKI